MTGETQAQDTVKVASAPFDKSSTADIIFRTGDHVHFYAHKIVLSLASTFFEGMFSISQPSPASEAQEMLDGLPVIDVPEDGATLDCVLRYCYPVRDPAIDDIQLLDRVLGAVIKYALSEAIELATAALEGRSQRATLEVYAIAFRHNLRGVALRAARDFNLFLDPPPGPPKTLLFSKSRASLCYNMMMEDLPAASYYNLMVSSCLEYSRITSDILFQPLATYRSVRPSLGLGCYPFNQTSADITLVSQDNKKFPVHRAVIEMQVAANPVFPLQSLLVPSTSSGTDDAGRPCFHTKEHAMILSKLLRLCYPAINGGGIPQWTNEEICRSTSVRLIASAQNYGLLSIVDTYRVRLASAISSYNPFSCYCIATLLGWYSEAHIAAKYMAKHTILPVALTILLDKFTAKQYYHILRFWYSCQEAMTQAIAELVPESVSDRQWMEDWYSYSATDGAKRSPTAILRLSAELLVLRHPAGADPIPPTDRAAFSKELIELSVELEAKLDEAIESIEFRLC